MEVTAVLQNKDPVMCAWGSRALALMYNLAKKERPKALETDW